MPWIPLNHCREHTPAVALPAIATPAPITGEPVCGTRLVLLFNSGSVEIEFPSWPVAVCKAARLVTSAPIKPNAAPFEKIVIVINVGKCGTGYCIDRVILWCGTSCTGIVKYIIPDIHIGRCRGYH